MSQLRGPAELYQLLDSLQIPYEYIEHPPVPTVEEAMKYWSGIDSGHCKNIFFRNHKGDRHYLVILYYDSKLNIRELEQKLRQGKLSFASDRRLMQYLGLTPGSVSPFGLINDRSRHVHLFIDKTLINHERLSFHPNTNTASLIIPREGLFRFLEHTGNTWELF
ncbi:MAG: prolyl-tRNA synthetase associated domain-containing protein [Bacteroidales bacterium]|jgi:Ala-tRNA(Pro) deacylase|nr:prolyl-tRNA synthetase associated domain-containing protein [Bacteroidales bacterium]MDX9926902.1 prolyl-tRNA synthetase associated domain-containing protein [Bacteroidales bacterium]HNX85251.1 prolyl-tRNA synthetase associated domain-containing protein [Bacteroidales bacterium]HOC47825.1 prolyl-tRNA synthetase associated domain-containing protein [Bacteroidales bacterium]HPS97053.1 prolyl-tRNA synthetase associated domain-containing protein [Bacteroidales bacterium]